MKVFVHINVHISIMIIYKEIFFHNLIYIIQI
jgi:hypothetical protein